MLAQGKGLESIYGGLVLLDSHVVMSVWLHRMKEGQKDIFYMAADSLDAASSAPFVERLVQRDYEVCSKHTSFASFTSGCGATALGASLHIPLNTLLSQSWDACYVSSCCPQIAVALPVLC